MTDQQHEYDIGDAVKVRKGVLDPDIEACNEHGGSWNDVSLAGWVGVIVDIEDLPGGREMLTIQWDSHTLRNVPGRLKRFLRQEVSFDEESVGEMRLTDEDVEPAEPRDTAAERLQACRELYAELTWDDTVADLREAMGIDRGWNHGDEKWFTRLLRAPLIAHAAEGPDVKRDIVVRARWDGEDSERELVRKTQEVVVALTPKKP